MDQPSHKRASPPALGGYSNNGTRMTGGNYCPTLSMTDMREHCWARLKERRAVATRYDKTAVSYGAGIAIAATLDWFKSSW
jgi:hypothetical protein